MTRLLHISDNHFGPQVRYSLLEPFRQFVQSARPDAVIISGDHTSAAKPEEFSAARLFFDSLKVPYLSTPGNHDLSISWRKRLRDPYGEYRRVFGNDLNTVSTINDVTVIILNSTKPYLLVNGLISHAQLRWFREQMGRVPPTNKVIVVSHHHFIPPPGYTHRKLVFNREAAMLAFLHTGIDLLLVGHEHRNFVGTSREYYPDYDHDIIVLQNGTTLSNRGHAREAVRNTFNEILIEGDRITINHYAWDEEKELFVSLSQHHFTHHGYRTATPTH